MIIKTVFACLCITAASEAGDGFFLPEDEVGIPVHQFKCQKSANPLAQQPGETHKQWLSRVMFGGADECHAVFRSQQRAVRRARDSYIRADAGKYSK